MLVSKLFSKTNKNAKEFESVNATLLQKAGFIDQIMAGVYTFLPLGVKVLTKIETIIREEMNTIGVEVFMPSLSPKQNWEQTKRLETVDVLMKTVPANKKAQIKNDSEYVLNPTHEDIVTPLAQKFNLSYKDFPFAVFQIQTKFRNEPRAKSGLLRCREFRMKDLYSFHTTVDGLKEYYEVAKKAYIKVFERLGIGKDTVIALASGGDFTTDYSHEFQTRCDAGEDTIFRVASRDLNFNREVAPSKAPPIQNEDELKELQEVEGVGIIGVEEVAKHIGMPVEQTTKTLLFENENGLVIAAAVRGGYDINEEKLRKVTESKSLQLLTATRVKEITKADVGYAGLLGLPEHVKIIIDESMKGRKNFEMGANHTGYHSIHVNFGRDLQEPETYYDIKMAKQGDLYPETDEIYEVFKAAEVGNIFPLHDKFTKAFNYQFTDEAGQKQTIYMGSYGIGPSRIMGVLVEKFHDESGIMWPEQVAPYKVHLLGLDLQDEHIKKRVYAFYELLVKNQIEVLFDDREGISPGEKFKDADLVGIPHRLVVSKRTGEQVEYKKRAEKNSQLLSDAQIIKLITKNS